jgi:hypothetical protein
MASIRRQVAIDVPVADVWRALRDFGGLDEMAVGFVTDTQLDGEDRIVTFINGTVLRERLLSIDDGERRVAWSIIDGPYTHHNGAAQVFGEGDGTLFVWLADLLPNEAAPATASAMEHGLAAIKRTLEGA